MTPGELSRELGHAYHSEPQGRKTVAIHLFGIRRAEAIRASGATIPYIVAGAGIPTSYVTELHKGMALAPLVVERSAGTTASCASCGFWRKRRQGSDFAECRRWAPQPGMGDVRSILWPETHKSDWCGEYAFQGL